jgi:hypothetical protein
MDIIVHLDVNDTICKFDSTKNKSNAIKNNEDMILLTIVKYLKGYTSDGNNFIPYTLTQLNESLSYITYKEYLKSKYNKQETTTQCQALPARCGLLSGPKGREREKISLNILDDFANCDQVIEMYQTLKKHLLNVDIILPSAIKLFNFLLSMDIKVGILFRTFGNDMPFIQQKLNKLFPNIKIEHKIFQNTIDGNKSFYQELSNQTLPFCWYIQDDYKLWHSHGEISKYGKRFPLINNVSSWFFDDNENIVCPINENGEYISNLEEYPKCKIILINTYENVIDDDYFINILNNSNIDQN